MVCTQVSCLILCLQHLNTASSEREPHTTGFHRNINSILLVCLCILNDYAVYDYLHGNTNVSMYYFERPIRTSRITSTRCLLLISFFKPQSIFNIYYIYYISIIVSNNQIIMDRILQFKMRVQIIKQTSKLWISL